VADRSRQAVEQPGARKTIEVAIRQPSARGW
jgi:hypothetical protein